MRATRISPWILVLSLAAVVPSTSGVRAADYDFATNIVYRLLSVEEVNGQLSSRPKEPASPASSGP